MKFLRTDDSRFTNLPGFRFRPLYRDLPDFEGGQVRMHYLDEGPRDGELVLCLHGEPTWAYLYRDVIPALAKHGYRAFAPDLIGFGRSDKPTEASDHSYERHIAWVRAFVEALDLQALTLVCHDWGGLIGLRLAAAMGERFSRIVVCNTALPMGDRPPGEAFIAWRRYCQETPKLPIGDIIGRGCKSPLTPGEILSFEAPFPDESYKVAPRRFPLMVPTSPDEPEAIANRAAWATLSRWEKPFLTVFGADDPFYRGQAASFQAHVPGAHGQMHVTLEGAGHFLQEDCGEELGDIIAEFMIGTGL